MVDFKKVLGRSSSSLKNINEAIQKLQKKGFEEDTRFWQPTRDKAGNGFAIIRFLPPSPKDGEEGLPFVRQFSHGFEGPGGWIIEKCPTTLDKECPICESNNELWNTKIEENQAIVRKRKRVLSYISNIYVVQDPANPDAQGKVFLFRYGKKIFDKLTEKMNPQFEGEVPLNPFDLLEGANFKVKVKKVEGYPNYDSSEFDIKSALLNGDESKLEGIWNSEYSLNECIDPKNFKSYDEILTRLQKVLKAQAAPQKEKATRETKETPAPKKPSAPLPDFDHDDDDLKSFQDLAEDI